MILYILLILNACSTFLQAMDNAAPSRAPMPVIHTQQNNHSFPAEATRSWRYDIHHNNVHYMVPEHAITEQQRRLEEIKQYISKGDGEYALTLLKLDKRMLTAAWTEDGQEKSCASYIYSLIFIEPNRLTFTQKKLLLSNLLSYVRQQEHFVQQKFEEQLSAFLFFLDDSTDSLEILEVLQRFIPHWFRPGSNYQGAGLLYERMNALKRIRQSAAQAQATVLDEPLALAIAQSLLYNNDVPYHSVADAAVTQPIHATQPAHAMNVTDTISHSPTAITSGTHTAQHVSAQSAQTAQTAATPSLTSQLIGAESESIEFLRVLFMSDPSLLSRYIDTAQSPKPLIRWVYDEIVCNTNTMARGNELFDLLFEVGKNDSAFINQLDEFLAEGNGPQVGVSDSTGKLPRSVIYNNLLKHFPQSGIIERNKHWYFTRTEGAYFRSIRPWLQPRRAPVQPIATDSNRLSERNDPQMNAIINGSRLGVTFASSVQGGYSSLPSSATNSIFSSAPSAPGSSSGSAASRSGNANQGANKAIAHVTNSGKLQTQTWGQFFTSWKGMLTLGIGSGFLAGCFWLYKRSKNTTTQSAQSAPVITPHEIQLIV